MQGLKIYIKRLRPEFDDLPNPRYMTDGSSGMDIYAALDHLVTMVPGDVVLIPTGFAIAIPPGFEAQIRPRSGLVVKHGISVANTPGTIDADYRGEVMVALVNLGKMPYIVRRGDRIAQMVIQRVYRMELEEVDYLEETVRGIGGFGHTGMR